MLKCNQQGCVGPEGESCIENLPFDQCPNVVDIDEVEEQKIAPILPDEKAQESGLKIVSTSRGASLDANSCDAFLRQRQASLVALVGGPNVGKTTLLAGIYEKCRKGTLSGYSFAGSETIRGFEQRCFLARERSGGVIPETQHTRSASELCFTHLSVVAEGKKDHWIMSDRSGEHFDRARDYPDIIADFSEIRRADVILFLVDGEKILNKHHQTLAELRALVLCLSRHAFLIDKSLSIVVTKSDRLGSCADKKIVKSRIIHLVSSLDLETKKADLETFFVASRPKKGEAEYGQGYEKLLSTFERPVERRTFCMPTAENSFKRFPDMLVNEGDDL